MVKASSLFYALIISLLISLITVSLITMSYYNHVELEMYQAVPDLIENCKSAEAILLSDFKNSAENSSKLLYEIKDSTFTSHFRWGLWRVGSIKTSRRKDTLAHSFLFGPAQSLSNAVLYLKDGITGLSISGNSRIIGDVYVPGGRVKPAFIAGQSFTGERLVTGGAYETPRNFPKVSHELRKSLKAETYNHLEKEEFHSVVNLVSNDFNSETRLLHSYDSLIIRDTEISGNIIIESARTLVISSSAKLKNVLCKAPKIYIQKGFKGTIQCIATELIQVDEDVTLTYPSSLVLLENDALGRKLSVSENSVVEGVVWLMKSSDKNFLSLDPNSTIVGQIISEEALEPRGKVRGQIIAKNLQLKTSSAFYKNHLLNADIEMSLPDWFVGVPLSNLSNNHIKICDL